MIGNPGIDRVRFEDTERVPFARLSDKVRKKRIFCSNSLLPLSPDSYSVQKECDRSRICLSIFLASVLRIPGEGEKDSEDDGEWVNGIPG
jgi:hypothetical protein